MNTPVEPTATPAVPAADARGNAKRIIGVVVSDKMTKTRVIAATEHYKHPLYGKFLKRTQKFHAHDADNSSKTGDTVEIVHTRPLSALKRWRIMRIISRGV